MNAHVVRELFDNDAKANRVSISFFNDKAFK